MLNRAAEVAASLKDRGVIGVSATQPLAYSRLFEQIKCSMKLGVHRAVIATRGGDPPKPQVRFGHRRSLREPHRQGQGFFREAIRLIQRRLSERELAEAEEEIGLARLDSVHVE